ncbi:MerR family transcriptional regulator [Pelomicrobium sp. G1]|uniref:MerR family transcriptional regulator n=1 Tax=unclassified Pelomicrobium TaxID=2815318 RepID=UPI003F775C31
MKEATYTITELAREFGVTTRTIRFYEDRGLLSPAREGRHRIYSHRDRVRLKLTLRGKRLGFSLSEIKELFDLYDARDETAQLQQFLVILDKRKTALEQQRRDIDAMLAEIETFEKQCRRIMEERLGQRASVAVPSGP